VSFVRFMAPKLLGAAITLLIALSLAFFLARAAGDPARNILGEFATEEQVLAKQIELGLDKPLPVQFVNYLGQLGSFDLGKSLRYSRPNWELIVGRFPSSIQLTVVAMLIATIVGLPLGVLAALKEGRIWDRVSVFVALFGQSIPLFWLGLMFILLFAVAWGWLPAGQSGTWQHLVLPAVTLSVLPMARIARLARSSLSEVLEETYITSARARGLRERTVVITHALRNAALPVVTIMGLQAGTLLSGAVTVEFVFAWPGLGTLATQAVQFRDFSLVQAIVIVGAVSFVLINLTVDLLYGIIDPRIREQGS